MIRTLVLWTIAMMLLQAAHATHNRAGEITYKQISEFSYEVTVITYTNTQLTSEGISPADRSELVIEWGDNTSSIAPRTSTTTLPDYYQLNIYKATHTYAGAGIFEIFVEDPNRNEGVDNISNSINVVFSIKTILHINPFLGFNNTPILLNPPIDKAGVNKLFIHNPAAFDPDGDSISYELTVCTGEDGDPIPSYSLPESSNRPIFIDPIEGNLTWDAPVKSGVYNIAFNIIEWRKGVEIGQISRDMQIEVFDTENNPPTIDSIDYLCVEAGEKATFEISAYDDENEIVSMWATGGAFQIDNPAKFTAENDKGKSTGQFTWNTQCNHLRKQPYQIVVKAQDNNSEVILVNQRSVYISIIGPAPKNLELNSDNNSIALNWDAYICDNHKGFNIYRSTKPANYITDSCSYGVPDYLDYEIIAALNSPNATEFIDNENNLGLTQGYKYCYMITAIFEDNYESKPSFEVCSELVRGTPIITNVSVRNHDNNEGSMLIAWSKPIDFDSLLHPGPLSYIIKRATGIWNDEFTIIDTLFSLNDTSYIDTSFNTLSSAYSYQIEIHNPSGLTELPMNASSIYPEFTPANKKLTMHFTQNTPWVNEEYIIYKLNNELGLYDSIGTSSSDIYEDTDLINGNSYCYQFKSIGAYDLQGIIKPIVNYSHRNCGIPMDTTPPIAPILSVESDCDAYMNTLTWELPDPYDEISKYMIYFSPNQSDEMQIIDSVIDAFQLYYNHDLRTSPTGCYAVSAFDSANNESLLSNIACIDNCEYYAFPNVFTPNGDNINDFFFPITPIDIIENHIESIDCKIYSRWGSLVYETKDPYFKWDGKSSISNKALETGVYYYVCDVYERRITGIEPRYIVGFVHLYTSNQPDVGE